MPLWLSAKALTCFPDREGKKREAKKKHKSVADTFSFYLAPFWWVRERLKGGGGVEGEEREEGGKKTTGTRG